MSFRTASPPRAGLVGTIVRRRISPEGHNTTPAAIFVPPMSSPMAPSFWLLLICGPRVIVKVMTVLPFLQTEDREAESVIAPQWPASPSRPWCWLL